MNRLSLVPAVLVLGLGFAAPADAQITARPDWNYAEPRQPYYESRQLAYDNGYREGLREGERDGSRREAFNFQDERTFQRAEKGFHRSFGDFGRYQQSFRTGFAAGYSEAYRRFSPGYGAGGYYGNRGPAYPNRGYGSGGGYGYSHSPAYANGVRDGYEKGREDARDRDSYYPLRHKWYRAGDHDYKREYGPRAQYENVYREGFKEGYDRGYREGTFRR
jgi:flagellar biosynthesis/type III secretory pathway protein FliH